MKKYISLSIIWITSLQFILFGANKFLLFFMAPPPADAHAQAFMGGMFGSYLAPLVGAVEIAGAVLLLIPRTRFIGLLFLIPVMLNIVVYHLAHDLPGNMIWIVVLALFAYICYNQKNAFTALSKVHA
jgi:putative oxidoreductase